MKDDVVLVEVSPEGVAQQSVAGKHLKWKHFPDSDF